MPSQKKLGMVWHLVYHINHVPPTVSWTPATLARATPLPPRHMSERHYMYSDWGVCVCVHLCIIYIYTRMCVCKCNAFVCICAIEHAKHRMYRCSVVQDMYGKRWENVWKGSILSMWIEISFFWEKIFGDSKFCCHGARFSAFTAATAAADPGRGFGWTIFGRERKEAASRRRRIVGNLGDLT